MARRPVLVLQLRPEDDTSNDEYRAILEHGGLEAGATERIRIETNGIPQALDPGKFSAIIVGGSPFDISTPEAEKSVVQKRIEAGFRRLFDVVVADDIPFLGACSGNGLLGNWCGVTISRRFGEPVGGVDLEVTDEGAADPLLAGFPRRFRALVGHKEACDDVPPGAVLLASSAACPVQMFRVKSRVYATQFHPEGDARGFVKRIEAYRNHGYFAPQDADRLIETVSREATPWAQKLLRRFVELHADR